MAKLISFAGKQVLKHAFRRVAVWQPPACSLSVCVRVCECVCVLTQQLKAFKIKHGTLVGGCRRQDIPTRTCPTRPIQTKPTRHQQMHKFCLAVVCVRKCVGACACACEPLITMSLALAWLMASPLTVVAAINSIEQGQLPQLHHICREKARHLTSALWVPIDIVQ